MIRLCILYLYVNTSNMVKGAVHAKRFRLIACQIPITLNYFVLIKVYLAVKWVALIINESTDLMFNLLINLLRHNFVRIATILNIPTNPQTDKIFNPVNIRKRN